MSTFLSLRRSAPAKLGFVAILFVAAVVLVRSLSLGSLADVDIASSEIRNRWLESIQILGNLRHHVARVRTEEAELLLGGAQDKSNELERYRALADDDIAAYRAIDHDADEMRAFDTFASDWRTHLAQEETLAGLVVSEKNSEAAALFRGDAFTTFRKAARELRQLVDLTHIKAQAARAHGRQTIATAQRFISDLILAMLALFAGLAFYFWRSFSRPLLEMAGSLRRLAQNDTQFKIPFENRRDEIGEMARSLAVLRRNSVELLETRRNLAMQADILAATLEKERELTAAQRNFLTTMSHEFRTPLTYIDGHAQRLIATREHAAPAQVAERAEKIRSAVFQMTSLVASLTAEMEMLNAPAEAQKRLFDPAGMLRSLVDYYKAIDLKARFDEHFGELPEMRGDPKLLRRAFSNLISNALKYSGEGSLVEISGRYADGTIEICVADHGVGIPAAELGRVRERFFRGSNAGSIPGTGIGLSLVQQIVEQHGGHMTIESELGHGTRVTVSLPAGTGKAETIGKSLEPDLVH
ncbi:MAG TPA: ATP-binding protein [Rhodomicrobium sp.]|nr:ATP-binding protein [Rhodomicrobium sp.]